ncbi:MAG: FAD:protein FMN transferase, partial [Clostridia bacterium]|nr:FAD:protein FMN transferase [Clostridia bacterium]
FWTASGGQLNCAMGSLLTLWHDCMEGKTGVPSAEALSSAAEHIGFGSVSIEDGKLVLSDEKVKFDLGAAAKGYAAESASAVAKACGCSDFALNLGGNVLLSGKKPAGDWVIGIQDPSDGGVYTKVYVSDCSVVTSGNYQRYRDIDGVRYHHIIDPETFMPAGRYDSVTVVCPDSLNADMLSTALFCMPEESGEALAESFGAEVLWIYPDGTSKRTEGFASYEK